MWAARPCNLGPLSSLLSHLWSKSDLNGIRQLVHASENGLSALDPKAHILSGVSAHDLVQEGLHDRVQHRERSDAAGDTSTNVSSHMESKAFGSKRRAVRRCDVSTTQMYLIALLSRAQDRPADGLHSERAVKAFVRL